MSTQGKHGYDSHLWGERVDDLTREGLCELADEKDSELTPRDRRPAKLALL